jgi:hypothetical protein
VSPIAGFAVATDASIFAGSSGSLFTHPKIGGESILVYDVIGTINDISVSAMVNDTITNVGIYNSDTAVLAHTSDATIVLVSRGI